ncbi:MAG: ATP-binding protein [Paludibacteraceae bacterium]|nr:ATP-binding protein [Paludibacteraceae bacterium]
MNYIKRDIYLERLKVRMHNGLIKIITGPRRSGKSWILSHIFTDYLLNSEGVKEEQIIYISFDIDDDNSQTDMLDPTSLKEYLYSHITSSELKYYVMLDEVQDVPNFERIVNGLAAKENVDVYVTGSNSKFLSSDINTIFRGRGDEIQIWPLTFNEYVQNKTESISELWKQYYTFGGMPGLTTLKTSEQKINYLKRLWEKTYISDVVERHKLKSRTPIESLTDELCSAIGSLTNPNKISNTIKSVQNISICSDTIDSYLTFLTESYLFEGAKRYNIKGKRYFESIKKYYCTDVGLRNARLNFRQQEITHIMENIIYIELRSRGYSVDVGVVEIREQLNGKQKQSQYEVDFIASNGIEKIYIQSAYRLDTAEKKQQELHSLLKIDDSFRKMVIVADDIMPYTDDNGITYTGLFNFLLQN